MPPSGTVACCATHGRVDSLNDVFAVGDVACWRDGEGIAARVEHWTNATEQAAHVAQVIAGTRAVTEPFTAASFVWSDQHNWKIQVIGRPSTGTLERTEGDIDAEPARAAMVYTDSDGALAGVITINWARKAGLARQIYAHHGMASEFTI